MLLIHISICGLLSCFDTNIIQGGLKFVTTISWFLNTLKQLLACRSGSPLTCLGNWNAVFYLVATVVCYGESWSSSCGLLSRRITQLLGCIDIAFVDVDSHPNRVVIMVDHHRISVSQDPVILNANIRLNHLIWCNYHWFFFGLITTIFTAHFWRILLVLVLNWVHYVTVEMLVLLWCVTVRFWKALVSHSRSGSCSEFASIRVLNKWVLNLP